MQWLSSRSVATVWLLAALSLVGWLIVNLDVAGWIILVVTVGLMAFELTRKRDGQGARHKARVPDEPTG
jgi:Flp pilus assembly protein TadB